MGIVVRRIGRIERVRATGSTMWTLLVGGSGDYYRQCCCSYCWLVVGAASSERYNMHSVGERQPWSNLH